MSKTRSVCPDQLSIDFEAARLRQRDQEVRKKLIGAPKHVFQPKPFVVEGVGSLPSYYDGDGINYRSRTEARWAVLFDFLNIRYVYEIDKFAMSRGASIPDFYLPEYEVFYEVGPDQIEIHEGKQAKAQQLANTTGLPVLVTKGFPTHRCHTPLLNGCSLSLPDPYSDKTSDAHLIRSMFPKLCDLKDWAGESISDAVDLARNYQFEAARDFGQRRD